MLKHFYDPHPGFGGPVVRLPEILKQAVLKLDNKVLKIDEVVEDLIKVAKQFDANIAIKEGMITATIKTSDGYIHSWRLIRYRELSKECV